MNTNRKILSSILLFLVMVTIMISFTGCFWRKSDTVRYNIQKEADYFNVYRRMTFINLRTGDVLYEAEGYFSLQDTSSSEIGLIFRVDKDEYKINYFSKHENVAYIIEQIENTHTNPYFYEIKIYATLPKIEIDSEHDK